MCEQRDRVQRAAAELLSDVVVALDELLAPIRGLDLAQHAFSQLQKVALVSLGSAWDSAESIRLLVRAGHGAQAAVLLRTLFDLYVSLSYIDRTDSEARAERYIAYDDVLAHKRSGTIRELAQGGDVGAKQSLAGNAARDQEIEKGYEAFRARYECERGNWKGAHWSGLDTRTLCKELCLLGYYAAIYQRSSLDIHSAARSLSRQLSHSGSGTTACIKLKRGCDDSELTYVLFSVSDLAIRVVCLCAKALAISDDRMSAFAFLAKRHSSLFGESTRI